MSGVYLNGVCHWLGVSDDGKTSVKSPVVSEKPVVSLTYGDNIIEMNLSLDSRNQFKIVTTDSWDSTNQNIISGNSKEPNVNKQGSISQSSNAAANNQRSRCQRPTYS